MKKNELSQHLPLFAFCILHPMLWRSFAYSYIWRLFCVSSGIFFALSLYVGNTNTILTGATSLAWWDNFCINRPAPTFILCVYHTLLCAGVSFDGSTFYSTSVYLLYILNAFFSMNYCWEIKAWVCITVSMDSNKFCSCELEIVCLFLLCCTSKSQKWDPDLNSWYDFYSEEKMVRYF